VNIRMFVMIRISGKAIYRGDWAASPVSCWEGALTNSGLAEEREGEI